MRLPQFLYRRKFWFRFLLLLILIPTLLLVGAVAVVYKEQDAIVQDLLETLNKDFVGKVEIKGSHISPFDNFPYISIDLEEVKVLEGKSDSSALIAELSEVYLGFNLWTIIGGNININDLKLKDGKIDLIQHLDGRLNIEVALSSKNADQDTTASEPLHIELQEIELENIDIHKFNEESDLMIDALIYEADAIFKTSPKHTYVDFESKFEVNIIQDGDTSFIKHKHFDFQTELDFQTEEELLTIKPTKIHLEHSEFDLGGSIDFKDDMNLDLNIGGNKKNYDLIFALAPEDLIPVLERYENRGEIFFEANIKGKSVHGNSPAVDAKFGCKNGFFKNTVKNKEVDDLSFHGTYSNGSAHNTATSKLVIEDFTAHPEEGVVSAKLEINNFDDPEIDFQLNTSFELEFWRDFFNLTDISELGGSIDLKVNFHDIINIDAPQHMIQKLNESYKAELKVKDLRFKYAKNDIPLEHMDLYAVMKGHQAVLEECKIKYGNSDLNMTGTISDLPAIIHHTDLLVDTRLKIKSELIDLFQLTGGDSTAVNERIKNLKLDLDLKSSALALTEYEHLPIGEFFIENLYADLDHYPHSLHDFHSDVLIDTNRLKVLDFKGMVDKSDFLLSGQIDNYALWFSDSSRGHTDIKFDFLAKKLRLEDFLSYKGENYVPEDYRHEELQDFRFHCNSFLNYDDSLKNLDFVLNEFRGKMKLHPLKFEQFKGRVHYEDDHLMVKNFGGKLGRSQFRTNLNYYLGEDPAIRIRDNYFALQASHLDVDEIMGYNLGAPKKGASTSKNKTSEHDSIFNIYELPFPDMRFKVDIGKLNYHQYTLTDFHTQLKSTPKHFLYIDSLSFGLAGGKISSQGYFNGSNPNAIYFSPELYLEKIDLDKVLLQFDNFGQDHLVSENVHGQFTGKITGKIHMHRDLVPIIDDSEIHLRSHIENGRLEDFAMLESFSDYFANKDLKSVRFDTLENNMDIVNGEVTIEHMTINSTLGFLEFSGKQDVDFNYEYNISVPWKLITKTVASKLFKKRKKKVDDQPDEIQYGTKKTKYVSIKLEGDSIDYSVKLSKRKKKSKKEYK